MRSIVLVLALAACGKAAASDCEARAPELAAWIDPIDREGASAIALSTHLVEARDLPLARRERAPMVAGTRAAITVDGVPAETPSALTDALTAARGERAARVLFAIETDAPMDRVATATEAAAVAGFTDAGVLFQRPSSGAPPPASSIDAELDAMRASPDPNNATKLARLGARLVADCKEMGDAFARVTPEAVEDKGRAIVAAVRPSLIACGCKVPMDDFRSFLFAVMGPGGRPANTIADVTLDGGAAPVTGATWADAAPALLAAKGKRVRLVAPTPSH
jgi:hypothetical protein